MLLGFYGRFSTDMQRHESIETQLDKCQTWAASRGHAIVKMFTDEAVSGRTLRKRDGLQRLIQAARRHEFDAVVVYSITRISRSMEDHIDLEREFRKIGMPILSVDGGNGDSASARFTRRVMQAASVLEVEQTAERVHDSMMVDARKALFNGGTPPYGYSVANRQYVVNEAESGAVRLIFKLYGTGHSYGEIIKELNAAGYTTRAGEPFKKTALHAMLNNPRYAGTYEYNRAPARVYGARNMHASKPEEEIVRIEDALPAIVDEMTWAKAQKRMQDGRRAAGRYRTNYIYLLSGVIKCTDCGRMVLGCASTSKSGRKYYYYRCPECNNGVRADDIEEFILGQLRAWFFDPDGREALVRALNKSGDTKRRDRETRAVELEGQIADAQSQIDRAASTIMKGCAEAVEKIMTAKIEEQSARLEKFQDELNNLRIISAEELAVRRDVRKTIDLCRADLELGDRRAIQSWISIYIESAELNKNSVDFLLKPDAIYEEKHTDNAVCAHKWCRQCGTSFRRTPPEGKE